jgi:F0F1-type ATP synthase membrane subunit b/b'
MADFALGLAAGIALMLLGYVFYSVLVVSGRADDLAATLVEIEGLRLDLAAATQETENQRERADCYYALFVSNANEIAALRKGLPL